jgi:glycolate oxidase iron-sulfur subunit
MEHIRGVDADVVTSANPGCLLQLDAGLRRFGIKGRVRHVMELLGEAYGEVDDD